MDYTDFVGVDEAGRGCWAGPIVGAAVQITSGSFLFRDSKTLSKAKREELFRQVVEHSKVGVGWVSAREIDEMGLSWANAECMRRAAAHFSSNLHFVIDGKIDFIKNGRSIAVIDADDTINCVSAASIVAKVLRDRYMEQLDLLTPGYGFATNAGYGTKLHVAGLDKLGPTSEHRFSYKPLAKYGKRPA